MLDSRNSQYGGMNNGAGGGYSAPQQAQQAQQQQAPAPQYMRTSAGSSAKQRLMRPLKLSQAIHLMISMMISLSRGHLRLFV